MRCPSDECFYACPFGGALSHARVVNYDGRNCGKSYLTQIFRDYKHRLPDRTSGEDVLLQTLVLWYMSWLVMSGIWRLRELTARLRTSPLSSVQLEAVSDSDSPS